MLFTNFRHVVRVTADRKRRREATTVTWTTEEPPRGRRPPPEDTMSKKEELSPEAKAAVTESDFWSLFFTEEIMDEIEKGTNDAIEEDFVKKAYTPEYLAKAPHIKHTDKVNIAYMFFVVV